MTREIIITAALDLLETYGLADTTMRRVAASLGVAPGALYWHIKNKQALIAALADEILRPVAGNNPEEFALSLRHNLLRYRDGAELTTAALSQPGSQAWRRLFLLVDATLAPLTPDRPLRAAGVEALLHVVLGATVMEQNRRQHEASLAPGAPSGAGDAEADPGVDPEVDPGADPEADPEATLCKSIQIIAAGLA